MTAKKTTKRNTRSASTKKRSAAKSRSRTRKNTQKKASVLTSRIFLVCLILLSAALSLITLFRLGFAGAWLYGALSLLVGNFASVLLIYVIAFGFWIIWTGCKKQLPARFWVGMLMMMAGWSLCAALAGMPQNDPWFALSRLMDSVSGILQGTDFTNYGLLGAMLSGMFGSLFSSMGSWIIAVTLLIISVVLVGWSMLTEAMELLKENSKQAISSMNARMQENRQIRKENRRLAREEYSEDPAGFDSSYGNELKPNTFSFEEAALLLDDSAEKRRHIHGRTKRKPSVFSLLANNSLLDDTQSSKLREKRKAGGKGAEAFSKLNQDKNGTGSNEELVQEAVRITGGFSESAIVPSFLTNEPTEFFGNMNKMKESVEQTKEKPQEMITTYQQAGLNQASETESSLSQVQKNHSSSNANSKPLSSRQSEDLNSLRQARGNSAVARAQAGQKSPEELIAQSSKKKSTEPKENPLSAIEEMEAGMDLGITAYDHYKLPKINLLNEMSKSSRSSINTQQAKENGAKLISILKEFNVPARLTEIHIGPSVTKFEISPGVGVRVNTITNLQNDIKMALAATDIRIEAPIPGKSAVGIEVPNTEKTEVGMKELMKNVPEKLSKLPLVFALGKDLLGENVYGRLDTMPHLLIAGATGSGKSVCVNSIITSILMRTRPDEVKMILVDPKKVEFTPYNGVPHLLSPVITDGDLANKALKVVVEMMDARYDLFEEAGVRNINAFNAFVDQNSETHLKRLPRIVVIIDELADLMLVAAKEVEQSIQRITQLARAAGIHLIVATQRPSVNVITGVIKANIPSRIAFAVSSSVDSRTILDQAGAERLLGYGDMLFLDNGETAPKRIQGVFIKDEEVNAVASFVKEQAEPQYDDAFITLKELQSQGGAVSGDPDDPLYDQIKHFVITQRKASTSLIQRRFSIGYARAARLMDSLEINGIIGPANGSKPREILVQMNYDE